MSAIFVIPNAFTPNAQSGGSLAAVSYLGIDEAGLVWRTTGLTGNSITVQLDGTSIDTIALMGTNLIAGNTVRIRLGATKAEVDGNSATIDTTAQIALGTPEKGKTLVHHTLPTSAAYGFLRLDFSATGNPDGFVEVSRLIVGKSLICDGINIGAEITYDNQTRSNLDPFKTKPVWKAVVSGFTYEQYWTYWDSFLRKIADQRGFMFVPDSASPYKQQQVVFGQVQSSSKNVIDGSDYNSIELAIQAII